MSLQDLSRRHGQSVIQVLDQELGKLGWDLSRSSSWVKMRFTEYMDYTEVLQEVLHIGNKIFTVSQNEVNLVLLLGTSQTSLPIRNPSAPLEKIRLLSLLTTGSKVKASRCVKGVFQRDLAPPEELREAFIFWPSMSNRDFRLLNLHQDVPFCTNGNPKSSASINLDRLCSRIRLALTDPSYIQASPEHQQSEARLLVQVFDVQEWLVLQLAGLGHQVHYCFHRSPADSDQSLSGGPQPQSQHSSSSPDSLDKSNLRHRLLDRHFLNWLVCPQGEVGGVKLTGFQSELLFILRNALTTPLYTEDICILKTPRKSLRNFSQKDFDTVSPYASRNRFTTRYCPTDESSIGENIKQLITMDSSFIVDSEYMDRRECGNGLLQEKPHQPLFSSPTREIETRPEENDPLNGPPSSSDPICESDSAASTADPAVECLFRLRTKPESLKHHQMAFHGSNRLNSAYEHLRSIALSGKVLFGSNIDAFGWTEYIQTLRSVRVFTLQFAHDIGHRCFLPSCGAKGRKTS